MKQLVAIILLSSCYHWLINSNAEGAKWDRFTTSTYYRNVKMVTEFNSFAPLYLAKEMPLGFLRMKCSKYCTAIQSCYAFNLYPTDSSYVCELIPDNLCLKRMNKVFLDWPGNEIWDKLTTGMSKPCLEIQYPPPVTISCSVMKPGCTGIWPNCSNCLRSCKDCYSRAQNTGHYECTFWPDGPSGTPIFGKCCASQTFLIKRVVNLATATNDVMYQMSFYDMKRMQLLKDYTRLEFHFSTPNNGYQKVRYTNFDLDTNGTLLSLTFYDATTPTFDMFNLKSRAPGPIPFVNVMNDRFGCGSFWLLDPNNATYCPGGGVGMLGPLQINGKQIIKTGIRYPLFSASSFITYTSVELSYLA